MSTPYLDREKPIKKKLISPFAKVGFVVFIIVLAVYIGSRLSEPFADYINSGISAYYRMAMAAFGGLFPFSLYELALITIPLQIIAVIWIAVRKVTLDEAPGRFLINILAAALLLYSGHLMALGVAYNTTPIAERLDIAAVEVTEDRLASVMEELTEEINELSPKMKRNPDGTSTGGYTTEQTSRLICDSYRLLSEKYGVPTAVFESSVKEIRFSNVMSYFSLTGIYTFYTGEANINSLYPSYNKAFTSAHELAHQRGVLRENEANFMAYLALSTSEDEYLRYSGALSMYGYISSALYRTNKDRYYEIAARLDPGARADIIASSKVSEEYGGTIFETISTKVNDLFLKSNGTEGVVSYGMVTRLTVAYFEAKNNQ